MITITEASKGAGAVLAVRAHPGARRDAIDGVHAGSLKVSVTAAPDRGRANDAIAGLLAECLGVGGGRVSLVSGPTSRDKKFLIEGLMPDEVRQRLAPFLEGAP
jgi:uncharacterized protein (TIGR00251 family)